MTVKFVRETIKAHIVAAESVGEYVVALALLEVLQSVDDELQREMRAERQIV